MADAREKAAPTSLKVASFAVDAVWYLSWAAAVLAIVGGLVVWSFPQVRAALVNHRVIRAETMFDLPLEVRYPLDGEARAASRAQGSIELLGHDDVVLAKPFETADLAAYLLYRLLVAVLLLWTLFQLRALMRAVRRGHPFDPHNPARIRRIACALIAAGLVGDLARFVWVGASFNSVAPVVKQALPGASVGYRVSFSWGIVVAGLILLAIAQAFDAGVRLQHDQDLTV